jgi:hypothetical protein
MGIAGASLRPWLQRPAVRAIAGLIVLAFGLLGLVRLGTGISHGWLDAMCITPAVAR